MTPDVEIYDTTLRDGTQGHGISFSVADKIRIAERLDAYHVSMRSEGTSSVCEATMKVRVGKDRAHTVADGDGPVNALDAALRSALVTFYPQLERLRLTDYKVRIIDSTTGTAATTRVLIQSSDGESEWGTIGVNENIIEASLQALVDSLECALLNTSRPTS